MSQPLLSVCLITYNHESYIRQAIDSVLKQKVNFEWEFIIADDCSSDNTREILNEYASKYPNKIRLILQEKNIGASENFMDLITVPKGKYIAYFEGDDYWTDEKKLQKQVNFLEANPNFVICFHRVEVKCETDASKNYISNPSQKEVTIFEDLAKKNYIHTLSCVFRNNLFGKFPDWFIDSPIGDYPLHLLNAQHGKIKFFEDVMGVYRVHQSGEWSLKSQKYQHEKWLIMLEFCYKHFYPLGSNEFEKQLVKILEFLCFTCFQERNYEEFSEYFKKITKLGKHLKLRTKLALYLRYIVGRQNTLARLYNKMR